MTTNSRQSTDVTASAKHNEASGNRRRNDTKVNSFYDTRPGRLIVTRLLR